MLDSYKGWNKVDNRNKKNQSYCRIISNNLKNNDEQYYLNCTDEYKNEMSSEFIPKNLKHTYYMKDESGTGWDDLCRCVYKDKNKNQTKLECIENIDGSVNSFKSNNIFEPINKDLEDDCSKYSSTELKNLNHTKL